MVTIRPYNPVEDRVQVSALDASFTTDKIYRLRRGERLSFVLEESVVSPAVHKDYRLQDDLDELAALEYVVVAEHEGSVRGLAAVKIEVWNNRAVIWHLYVAPEYKGIGIGRALIEACDQYARSVNARCLWLETQTINYPAIQFYHKMGFELCGLDTTLYETETVREDEIALFFARPTR